MAELVVRIEGVTPSGGAIPIVGAFTPPFRTSVAAGAKANAPSAGTAVATIASSSLPAGLYDIEVHIGMSGTLAAVDVSNMDLRIGGTTVVPALAYTSTNTSNDVAGPFKFRSGLSGSQSVSVNAVASATASSVYSATIVATQVN